VIVADDVYVLLASRDEPERSGRRRMVTQRDSARGWAIAAALGLRKELSALDHIRRNTLVGGWNGRGIVHPVANDLVGNVDRDRRLRHEVAGDDALGDADTDDVLVADDVRASGGADRLRQRPDEQILLGL